MSAAKQSAKRNVIEFAIGMDGKPEGDVSAELYVFDASGALLGRAPLLKGVAALSIDEAQLKHAQLYVAPPLPESQPATPQAMRRLNAYEPVFHFKPDISQYELAPIPELHWPFLCRCRVRGRVIKRETVGPVTYDWPVCNARVHVCEVDPWRIVLPKLPDLVIDRLRDELLRWIERPIVFPPPLPDPPPFSQLQRMIVTPDKAAINPQPTPPQSEMLAMAQVMVPLPMRAKLVSGNHSDVRDALLKHIDIVKPLLCQWDWLWPYLYRWYTCDEVAVVMTDSHGRFDTTIFYPCLGDKPDLYFWVEYSIGGAWETVYRPALRCNTFWDYACGTEVTLVVGDARVHGCGDNPPLLGKKVVVRSVGNAVSMGEIYRAVDGAALEGLAKPGWIHATKPSPFGSQLELRVDFGTGLKAANITHYRWSYRLLGSTDEADWKALDAHVYRNYEELTPVGAPVVYKSLQIAPDPLVTGHFGIIDPVLPAGGVDWKILNEHIDLASAYFDTPAAAAKYELKLELFRKVGSMMQRVDLTAEGVELYEMTDPAPFGVGTHVTAPALADRALLSGAQLVGYRLVLHVDNRSCAGAIDDVVVNGKPAGKCGFLEYASPSDAAEIAFHASHPAGFAWFNFDAVRVSTTLGVTAANAVVNAASVNGFTRSGDMFSKSIRIDTLMSDELPAGETPCTRAAFAEALNVHATATNGYGRLDNLDAPMRFKAFAITPK